MIREAELGLSTQAEAENRHVRRLRPRLAETRHSWDSGFGTEPGLGTGMPRCDLGGWGTLAKVPGLELRTTISGNLCSVCSDIWG